MTRRTLLEGIPVVSVAQASMSTWPTPASNWECPVHGKLRLYSHGFSFQEVLKFTNDRGWESPHMCLYCVVDFLASKVPDIKKV